MKILPVSIEQAKEQSSSFFIELYNIYLKTGTIRICNCDVIIEFNGYQYYPVPIKRGSIKSSVDSKIDNVDLTIADADTSKISALLQGFDFRGRTVEIFKIQYPESLSDNSIYVPIFVGYLDAPNYSNGEFSVTVKAAFPKINIPFRKTQYFCNNTFGDELCKMDLARQELVVDSALSTPDSIKIDGTLEPDFYKNGLITIGYETKMIKTNSENYITTYYPFQVDLTGTAIITRNCDKTPENCSRYNNRQNYGGFLAIPKEFRLS